MLSQHKLFLFSVPDRDWLFVTPLPWDRNIQPHINGKASKGRQVMANMGQAMADMRASDGHAE